MIILHCDDTIEGMLTAIYEGFVYKKKSTEPYQDTISIAIGEGDSRTLFATEVDIETDTQKAEKTIGAIRKQLGFSILEKVIAALCHESKERGTIVFGFLVRAFRVGPVITEYLKDPFVFRCFELERKVYNELDKMQGFLRFSDTGRFLFAELEPKCNLVPLLAEHFADRYPAEHFVIYDNKRQLSYVHPAYQTGFFTAGQDLHGYGKGSDPFAELWKQYFSVMGIKERENERCQNTLLPKWYRKNMVEFMDV